MDTQSYLAFTRSHINVAMGMLSGALTTLAEEPTVENVEALLAFVRADSTADSMIRAHLVISTLRGHEKEDVLREVLSDVLPQREEREIA